uniref:Uncharacterized protein n=1 Tax=Mycena chlorophos TaxID=658473 RepID=A0ABQ0M195_MYCCL|nr:predicted protein [Mycena chlorophos]
MRVMFGGDLAKDTEYDGYRNASAKAHTATLLLPARTVSSDVGGSTLGALTLADPSVRSSTVTECPPRARVNAVARPAIPPPTMTMRRLTSAFAEFIVARLRLDGEPGRTGKGSSESRKPRIYRGQLHGFSTHIAEHESFLAEISTRRDNDYQGRSPQTAPTPRLSICSSPLAKNKPTINNPPPEVLKFSAVRVLELEFDDDGAAADVDAPFADPDAEWLLDDDPLFRHVATCVPNASLVLKLAVIHALHR